MKTKLLFSLLIVLIIHSTHSCENLDAKQLLKKIFDFDLEESKKNQKIFILEFFCKNHY